MKRKKNWKEEEKKLKWRGKKTENESLLLSPLQKSPSSYKSPLQKSLSRQSPSRQSLPRQSPSVISNRLLRISLATELRNIYKTEYKFPEWVIDEDKWKIFKFNKSIVYYNEDDDLEKVKSLVTFRKP